MNGILPRILLLGNIGQFFLMDFFDYIFSNPNCQTGFANVFYKFNLHQNRTQKVVLKK